jgi:hypothetical protein
MAATMAEVRQALADVCATVIPRSAPYMLPKPEVPALCVMTSQVTYGETFDNGSFGAFDLWVYVSPNDLVKAQQAIDVYMAPTGALSLKAALDADPSLGGVVDYVKVIGWQTYSRLQDVAGAELFAAPLRVEVHW